MNHPTKYAAYVIAPLSEARIDAQWTRIASRLPPPKASKAHARRLVWAFAACALVASWWLRPVRTAESVWEGSVVASDDAPVDVTLAEGTLIELDPRSEVKLMRSTASSVQVMLSGGSALFDVAKKRNRRFSVQVGSVEILVTGTQFRVERTALQGGERVRVDVEEGSVEVRRSRDEVVALRAGDHWSAFVAPMEEDAFVLPREPEVAGEEDRAGAAKTARRSGKRRGAKSLDAGGPARELFDRANLARRAGRLREAAQLYAELARKHPRDRRAALSAFELGRLRMDSLSEMRGAIQAFEQALKLDARRSFAEDAMARLVLAYEAVGDRSACARTRQRYLQRYPDGVHVQHVSARCGGI